MRLEQAAKRVQASSGPKRSCKSLESQACTALRTFSQMSSKVATGSDIGQARRAVEQLSFSSYGHFQSQLLISVHLEPLQFPTIARRFISLHCCGRETSKSKQNGSFRHGGTPTIPTRGRYKQGDQAFKACLKHIVNMRPAWVT